MTGRLQAALSVLLISLLTALSLGGPVFYLITWTLALMLAYGLLSALLARQFSSLQQGLLTKQVERGDQASLHLQLQQNSPLPIGQVQLSLSLPEGPGQLALNPGFLKPAQMDIALPFNHVGVYGCGATALSFMDLFGLFKIKKTLRQALPSMLVLPRSFEVEPLDFARMEDGRAQLGQSGEDVTSPEDTRAYRQGDPFKRIHWKLSSRSQELVVRRFEVPTPPDTLILMDCTQPEGARGDSQDSLRLRDTLCETALSVAKAQIRGQQAIRLPLYGARQNEINADKNSSLQLLREELAYQIFRGGEPFPRVLALELRRMRRTGATVVISTRLDAGVVQGVINIRASGPKVRFYLVSFEAEHPRFAPYIAQLQQRLVEVSYVTPA